MYFTPAGSYSVPGVFPIGSPNSRDYTDGMQNGVLTNTGKSGRFRGWQQPVFIAGFLLLSMFVDPAIADSFRCGRKVVRTGDSPAELLQRCGEPRYKDRGYENLRVQGGQKKLRVERWYYKKSSRQLEQIVLIHKGRIVAINTGRR